MKKQIALFAIVAAALVAAPVVVRAADKPAKDAASTEAGAKSKKHGLPFHGKVTAVDTAAMTVTVGTMTINVTSETKITKEGKPATLSDITVGENIGGAYMKDDAGKMNATTIHLNMKGGKKAANGETKKKKKDGNE